MRAELAGQALGVDLWYRDPLLETDDGIARRSSPRSGLYSSSTRATSWRAPATSTATTMSRASTGRSGLPGEPPVIAGVDMVKFDADGKLHRIVGFSPEEIV